MLLAGLTFLWQRSTNQYSQLSSAQSQLQQALDTAQSTDSLQASELEALTQRIAQLRTELDTDLPTQLEDQYTQLLQQLQTLAQSSDQSLATTAQTLLSSLTNQAGEGIGLSGTNNTTIHNKGVISLNGQTGTLSLQGTPNQTTVTTTPNGTTIGTAQDIAASSSPTFNNQTLAGNQTTQGNLTVQGTTQVADLSATQSSVAGSSSVGGNLNVAGTTTTNTLTIQSTGTQNGYTLCDISNNCGYSGAGSSYVQGGNSFGNPATLGTNDNNSLSLRTNNQNRVTIGTDGNTSFTGNITTPGSVSAGAVTAATLSGDGAGVTNVDAATLQGLTAGNSSGQIALNNGTLNTNLNADLLDGQHGAFYQNADNLNTGTLSDARLSSNVALQNAANTFSLQQTFTGGFQGTTGTLSGNFTVNGATALQGMTATIGTFSGAVAANSVSATSITATGFLQGGNTVCDNSNNCNYASASGSNNYIWNGTTTQTGNINIQSASASSIGMVIQGAVGQTANLMEWQNASGTVIGRVASNGAIRLGFNIPLQAEHSTGDGFVDLISRGAGNDIYVGNGVSGGTRVSALNVIELRVGTSNGIRIQNSDVQKSGDFGYLGSSATPWNRLFLVPVNGSNVALSVRAANSQSADLQQWLSSSSNIIARISASGQIFQGANQVCDTSNNCNYAASTGGSGYIQNQTASPQTAGFNITGNGTIGGALLVQGGISSPGVGTNSEAFGLGATTGTGNQSLAVGYNALTTGSSQVAVGRNARVLGTSGAGVAIGGNAASNDQNAIAIGSGASSSGNQSIAIGSSATTTSNSAVAIGSVSSAAANGVAIGLGATVGHFGGIALGSGSTTTANGQFVVGDRTTTSGHGTYTNGYFGRGVTSANPVDFTFNATGGEGENIQGGNIAIAGGRGTGNAAGGNILFQTSAPGASGTTLRNLTTRAQIHGGSGNMSIGTTSDLGQLAVVNTNASQVGLVVQGAASQSANIVNIQNNGGSSLLNVAANGNVGVGFNNPTDKLHVEGNLRVGQYNSLNYLVFGTRNTVGTSTEIYLRTNPDGSPNQSWSIGTQGVSGHRNTIIRGQHGVTLRNDSEHALVLNNQGNVGIGQGINLEAAARLHVMNTPNGSGGSRVVGIFQGTTSQTGDLLQAQDSTGAVLASISATGKLTVKSAEVEGDLVVVGSITTTNITVNGKIIGNADTRGTVTVGAGNTTEDYVFTTPYASTPTVVISPIGKPGMEYWLSNISPTGFRVNVDTPPGTDMQFNFMVQQ